MRRRMRWPFVLLGIISIALLIPGAVLQADGPFDGISVEDMPACLSMPEAQIAGYPKGAACRVPVRPAAGSGALSAMLLYRSGWTNRVTSESDSDLVEDTIKAEGWLYWIVGGSEYYDDSCVDTQSSSTHAACRNSTSGSGTWHQNGRHYFHKTGYIDEYFQTDDYWSS